MDQTTIIIISVLAVILFLSLLLTIASFSSDKFFNDYKKLAQFQSQSAFTVSSFVAIINHKYFNNVVKIKPINVVAGDYYDSKNKVVALNVTSERSLAGFAVVAHELGHAYQDNVENNLKSFNSLRRFGMFIGKLFLPVLIATIIALFFVDDYVMVLAIGGGVEVFIVLLAIVIKAQTIAIEKDASRRGLELLKEVLSSEEIKKCKTLLDSARLTYWADLIKLLLGWSGLTNKTEMFR